jgi:hypothetical protein
LRFNALGIKAVLSFLKSLNSGSAEMVADAGNWEVFAELGLAGKVAPSGVASFPGG